MAEKTAAKSVEATPAPSPWRSRLPWIVSALLAIAVIALAVGLLTQDSDDDEDEATWQAVFLSSGQVYFGHLGDTDGDEFDLTNIYYLQVQQVLQPAPEPANTTANASQQVSLAKLGKFELHCPIDKMTINREQVLFWETLQNDSKVVKAINEYAGTPDADRKCYEEPTGGSTSVTPPTSTAPAITAVP